MNPSDELSLAETEELIRIRSKLAAFGDCAELDVIAASVEGKANEIDQKAALSHLQSCSECAQAVQILEGLVSKRVLSLPPEKGRDKGWFVSMLQLRPRLAVAGLVLMILGMALLGYLGLRERPEQEGSRLQIKGQTDRITVVLQRGQSRRKVEPQDRVEQGDQLAFFYSAEKKGFLAILVIDQQHNVEALIPAAGKEPKSIPIRAGQSISLVDGGIVETGQGCEWIVAVFSDQALDTVQLGKMLQGSTRIQSGCRLVANLPQARSVQILPLVR